MSTGPQVVQLPGGLVLRRATRDDHAALVELQGVVHGGADGPNVPAREWARDLLPRTEDVTVVEDTATGRPVSSLTLVRQTWAYDGIPFGVGRVELVATHPDYRRRGLIRRQFDLLHEWSAGGGDLVQAITDLMFFHEEHGYRMALVQRAGRGGHVADLPPVPAGGEPVRLRPATTADVPVFMKVDDEVRERALLTCVRDEGSWEHELTGRGPANMMTDRVLTVEGPDGPLGYAVIGYGGIPTFPIPDWFPGSPCPEPVVSLTALELLPGASWLDVVPSVLRQVATGSGYLLWSGTDHPAYTVMDRRLVRRPPNAGWFLRMPDKARFLQHIAPALQRRLAASPARGFTGVLRLHLYADGLVLRFADGRLTEAAPWPDAGRRQSDASMPEQLFLQLLLGHGTFAELAPAYPDARLQTSVAEVLLPVLFTKRASTIWPIA